MGVMTQFVEESYEDTLPPGSGCRYGDDGGVERGSRPILPLILFEIHLDHAYIDPLRERVADLC